MARAKGLSADDMKVWAAYSQTLHRLMPGRNRLPVVAEVLPETVDRPLPAPVVKSPESLPGGLDKATRKKFVSGQMRVQARLDLHGMTAARAHHAVNGFVERAYAEQTRCVEIITGKGEVLARELPHWLNAPGIRPMILAAAHGPVGNTGALRVLLRRVR